MPGGLHARSEVRQWANGIGATHHGVGPGGEGSGGGEALRDKEEVGTNENGEMHRAKE